MVDTEMEDGCRDRNPIPIRSSTKSAMLSWFRPTFMKGDSPAILYNMCLGLDKLYSEPIDGMDESIRKKVYALFMEWWNTFHVPAHIVCFLMDKAFSHMDHDSEAKVELIQVIKDFCTVETTDGTKVGRDWKVVKSECVPWQESIVRKQHDPMMNTSLTNLQVSSLSSVCRGLIRAG
jgi:hypothetical protein